MLFPEPANEGGDDHFTFDSVALSSPSFDLHDDEAQTAEECWLFEHFCDLTR